MYNFVTRKKNIMRLCILCDKVYFKIFTGIQEEFLSLRNESGTRTTVVVNMKGDVDIMISPLVLESLQR